MFEAYFGNSTALCIIVRRRGCNGEIQIGETNIKTQTFTVTFICNQNTVCLVFLFQSYHLMAVGVFKVIFIEYFLKDQHIHDKMQPALQIVLYLQQRTQSFHLAQGQGV